jgi:hypothetical protein
MRWGDSLAYLSGLNIILKIIVRERGSRDPREEDRGM